MVSTNGMVGYYPVIDGKRSGTIRGFIVTTANAILLADDSKDDLEMVQGALKNLGISNPVFVTTNGNQVIDYLTGTGIYADRNSFPLPTVLLLDLNMPGADGFDVLQWCKTHPELEGLLIVVLSGHHGMREVNQAYALGADAFIFKPCREADLLNLIRSFPDHWIQHPPPESPPTRPSVFCY
jgi:CheY-like chemotaxis protein